MKKIPIYFFLFFLIPWMGFAQSLEKEEMDRKFEERKEKPKTSQKKSPSYINDSPFDEAIPLKANSQLQVLVLSYTQGVMQNIYAENQLLKGQIVGRLFGANTTSTTNKQTASYFEQRTVPFFIYSPAIFDGKATIRASFKLDWTWGDNSYGTGGHAGGALSADQVNLQTQNVEIEYKFAPGWSANLGIQRLFDSPHDSYRTTFDKFVNTGYRLAYWGTNGAGLSVRKDADWYKLKTGFYKLYENTVEKVDDVSLYELTSQFNVSKNWNVGGSVYYLRDRSNGKGGVSILGQGPRSLLTDYNGAYNFKLGGDPIKTDLAWVGAYFSRNEDMMNDRFFTSGYVNSNIGQITQDKGSGYKKAVDILGVGANLRAGYRYGQSTNEAVTADVVFSSANKNGIENGKYTGVITGNTWGSPVGLMIGQGTYLLFPHANVVNRYVSAVSDMSNIGYGMTGATLSAGYDFVPHKFQGKIGSGMAFSNDNPKGGGNFIGWELNGKLVYNLGAFFSIEAHAAYMGLGDFYDSKEVNGGKDKKPVDPWTSFLAVRWLIF